MYSKALSVSFDALPLTTTMPTPVGIHSFLIAVAHAVVSSTQQLLDPLVANPFQLLVVLTITTLVLLSLVLVPSAIVFPDVFSSSASLCVVLSQMRRFSSSHPLKSYSSMPSLHLQSFCVVYSLLLMTKSRPTTSQRDGSVHVTSGPFLRSPVAGVVLGSSCNLHVAILQVSNLPLRLLSLFVSSSRRVPLLWLEFVTYTSFPLAALRRQYLSLDNLAEEHDPRFLKWLDDNENLIITRISRSGPYMVINRTVLIIGDDGVVKFCENPLSAYVDRLGKRSWVNYSLMIGLQHFKVVDWRRDRRWVYVLFPLPSISVAHASIPHLFQLIN